MVMALPLSSDMEADQILAKVLEQFYDKKNIEFKTDLNTYEITSIFKDKVIDTWFWDEMKIKLNLIKEDQYYMYEKVSDGRLGRREGVEVMKAQVEKESRLGDMQKALLGR